MTCRTRYHSLWSYWQLLNHLTPTMPTIFWVLVVITATLSFCLLPFPSQLQVKTMVTKEWVVDYVGEVVFRTGSADLTPPLAGDEIALRQV